MGRKGILFFMKQNKVEINIMHTHSSIYFFLATSLVSFALNCHLNQFKNYCQWIGISIHKYNIIIRFSVNSIIHVICANGIFWMFYIRLHNILTLIRLSWGSKNDNNYMFIIWEKKNNFGIPKNSIYKKCK